MAVPSGSNFPTSLDSDTTLFADPANQQELTLANGIGAGDTSLIVNEAITAIAVPTFLTFATGEIVYAEAKDNGAKQFSSLTRGAGGTSAQTHSSGEVIRQGLTAEYVQQLKAAIIAIETELGTDPSSATWASVALRLANHAHSGGDHGVQIATSDLTGHTKAAHDALAIDADQVDGIDAAATAQANKLLALDGNAKLPASITGDADTVDGIHASASAAANKLLALDGAGKLPASITGDADTLDGKHLASLEDIAIGVVLGGSGIYNGDYVDIPYVPAFTITRVAVMADASGSVNLDILKSTFPTVPTATICGSDQPNLSSVQALDKTTFTGWTLAVAEGSSLRIKATNDATTIKQLTLVIYGTRD